MRLGAMFDRERPPEELVPFARSLEAMGFDELWVVEDCFWAGGLTAAAAGLAATDELGVGIGIAPAPLRNAALLAMEAAGLARMFPGRFQLGIGHGVQSWMGQVGEQVASPLTLLDETLTATRALLAGGRVAERGTYVRLDGVALVHPPVVVPPVLSGVVQPRSLALSGRVADGTILCEGTTPEAVAASRRHIDEGRAAAGRTDPHRLVVFAFLVLDADASSARARARSIVEHVAANQHAEPADDMVIAGKPADAAALVRRFEATGIDALALRPVGDDPEGDLRALLAAL